MALNTQSAYITFLTRLSVIALAVMVFGPAFRSRFLVPETLVYYVPFALFFGATLVANALYVKPVAERIKHSLIYLLFLFGPLLGFFLVQMEEPELFYRIAGNAIIGAVVIFFPWNTRSLHALLQTFAVFGAFVSLHTILFYGSDEAINAIRAATNPGDTSTVGYLAVSFVMGIGVLCATYLVVRNFNPITLSIFAVNWLGLAMGRGRGAFLFCLLVAIVYLVAVLRTRIVSFQRPKKIVMLLLIACFVPIVFTQMMKISRMRWGLYEILFNLDVEAVRGGRAELFTLAYNAFADSPLVGNGLGAYYNPLFGHPHNVFLQWMVDSGLVGFAALLGFFFIIGMRIWQSLRLASPGTINLVFCITGLFLYMILNFMKSYDAYYSRELVVLSSLPIAGFIAVLADYRARKLGRFRQIIRIREFMKV